MIFQMASASWYYVSSHQISREILKKLEQHNHLEEQTDWRMDRQTQQLHMAALMAAECKREVSPSKQWQAVASFTTIVHLRLGHG